MSRLELPVKTREMFNHHFDSTKWNDFSFRDGDIIVTTAYKSGTTWVQNILVQLLHQGKVISKEETLHSHPWLDWRFPPLEVQRPALEAMTERRHLKTHLRLDALVFSPKAKYIFVGRDGRDCYMSLVNHYRSGNDNFYHVVNDTPGLQGPPLPRFNEEEHSEKVLFDRWISEGWPSIEGETDGYPFYSFFDHAATWWSYRHLPNILFIHYADMLEDSEGAIREIASFLDIPIDEEYLPAILQAVSFEGMQNNLLCVPADMAFTGGAKAFVNKGRNGRWKGVLSDEQLAKYQAKVSVKFTPECTAWFAGGKKGFDPKTPSPVLLTSSRPQSAELKK